MRSSKRCGERRRIELYEILAPKHDLSPERERSRDHFWRGVIYFREKQWEKAAQEFSKARITGIPDAALDFYIQRVERSRRGEEDVQRIRWRSLRRHKQVPQDFQVSDLAAA